MTDIPEDMIERVARAMAVADLDEETAMAVDLDAHMAFVSEHYRNLASAAIKAMHDPNEAMLKAASRLKSPCTTYRAIYRAMISAALSKANPTTRRAAQ